ncbi:MAG: hypothetical protein WC967_12150 [Balneolaceae bacterium]
MSLLKSLRAVKKIIRNSNLSCDANIDTKEKVITYGCDSIFGGVVCITRVDNGLVAKTQYTDRYGREYELLVSLGKYCINPFISVEIITSATGNGYPVDLINWYVDGKSVKDSNFRIVFNDDDDKIKKKESMLVGAVAKSIEGTANETSELDKYATGIVEFVTGKYKFLKND